MSIREEYKQHLDISVDSWIKVLKETIKDTKKDYPDDYTYSFPYEYALSVVEAIKKDIDLGYDVYKEECYACKNNKS